MSNSINSRNSLFSGIRVHPGLQVQNHLDALLRRQPQVFLDIGGIGLFEF